MWTKLLSGAALVAGLSVSAGSGALAAGFLYECDMPQFARGNGWISPKIAIVLPKDGEVSVIDALTLTFEDAPVPATVLTDTATRFIVKWTLKDVKADNGHSFDYFDYQASITKKSLRIRLTAAPRDEASRLRSNGICRKRTE